MEGQVQEAAVAGSQRRNRTIVLLAVAVAIQSVALLIMALAFSWSYLGLTPLLGGEPDYEPGPDYWAAAEQAVWDLDPLFDGRDVDTYLSLYESDDPATDLDEVRRQFEAACERLDSGAVDTSAGMIKVFKDDATEEIIVRVGLELLAGDGPPEKLAVYVLYDGIPLTLTGIEGRQLSQEEVLPYN